VGLQFHNIAWHATSPLDYPGKTCFSFLLSAVWVWRVLACAIGCSGIPCSSEMEFH